MIYAQAIGGVQPQEGHGMTDEAEMKAVLEQYAKLDPDGWKGLHADAETSGKGTKYVAENIIKTMNDPDLLGDYFKEKSKDEILVLSGKIVRASIEGDLVVPAVPYSFFVLGKTDPRSGTSKAGNEYTVTNAVGLGKKAEAGSALQFVKVAAFGDEGVDKVGKLEPGKTYKVVLKGSNPAKLSLSDGEDFEATDEESVNTKEVLLKMFPTVPINEVPNNLRKNARGLILSDLKLVLARIVFSTENTRQDGSKYGRLLVLDDSVTPDEKKKGGGLTVYIDPSWLTYGPGSDIYLLGAFSRRKNATGNNPFVMNAEALIPEVPLPVRKKAAPAAAKAAEKPKEEAYDFENNHEFDLS